MRKSRFSEEQIIHALKEHEAGTKTADICRRLGISDQTFYRWKAKYGGLEVSDARRLKHLEIENAKLLRMLGQRDVDIEALRFLLRKKF
jgi:putative transposase